jgi:hypothetical protein
MRSIATASSLGPCRRKASLVRRDSVSGYHAPDSPADLVHGFDASGPTYRCACNAGPTAQARGTGARWQRAALLTETSHPIVQPRVDCGPRAARINRMPGDWQRQSRTTIRCGRSLEPHCPRASLYHRRSQARSISGLELILIYVEGPNFRFQGRAGDPKFGRCSGGTGHPASAFTQRRLNHLSLFCREFLREILRVIRLA